MAMTKRDFEAFARMVNSTRDSMNTVDMNDRERDIVGATLDMMISRMTGYFESFNPRFDADKFQEAAGFRK
jgi:hypothetical protein